jgi:enoyl-CoA hydratase
MSDLVLCETRGAVALMTLNRPEKLNALSYALIDRVMQLLDAIEDNPSVRAIILTGAGDRAFSAGADISEFSESIKQGPDAAVKAFVRRGQAMTARMEAFPRANRLPLPSPKSISAFRPHSAERNACRVWSDASALSNIF